MTPSRHDEWHSIDFVREWYRWKETTGVDRPELEREVRLLRCLLPGVGAPRVLDLGCGPGRLSRWILQSFPEAEVTGLDISAACGEVAQEVVAEHRGRFRFVLGDLEDPSALAGLGVFDAVVSSLVIHNVAAERRRDLFAAVAGILRPGGVFLNFDHVGFSSPTLAPMLESLQAEYISEMPARIQARFVRSGANTGRGAGMSLKETLEALAEAGFAPVDVFWRWLTRAIYVGLRA